MEFSQEVQKATDPIYQKISKVMPEIEWSVHAPYIHKINELKKNNLPYIVVLTDPTAGGITASYAMLGDIHIAEPGALIAFAGARVIQGTVREELPVGFQRSEYVEKTGFVDLIVERKDLREKIRVLLSILLKKNSAINTATNETSEDSRTLTKAAS